MVYEKRRKVVLTTVRDQVGDRLGANKFLHTTAMPFQPAPLLFAEPVDNHMSLGAIAIGG
jgi:hypothetical protein